MINATKRLTSWAIALLLASQAMAQAGSLRFAGYTWNVRSGPGGPGPNTWNPDHVWLDDKGNLHLKLAPRQGVWQCAELTTQKRFGFGRYQFSIVGRVDKLDKNVVFGLFNYPTSEVGPDSTCELDIEFSRWGRQSLPIGNYTVWPVTPGSKPATKPFAFELKGDRTTHRFTWNPTSLFFQSLHGHYDDDTHEYASWRYEPKTPQTRIAQQSMPLHINLWCFQGHAPTDGQPVEVVVRSFKFTPYSPLKDVRR